jgi:ABC-type lipoprotein export system ATPase subunit
MVNRVIIAMSLALFTSSGIVLAQTPVSKLSPSETEAIKQLLSYMDKDKNGKVSKAEFMSFMSSEFDRLDVHKDGELDVDELGALRVVSKHPGGTGSR